MEVVFLGVGEAFDENMPNNSHLVITGETNLLLDCGMTAAPQVWKFNADPNFLDAIYISHWHADHYFGLPGLLLRMWEDGRTKDIAIISRKGFKEQFFKLMDLAYSGFLEKFKFKINIIEAKDDINFNDLNLSFVKTIHSGENLAIKINNGNKAMVYGGDGSPVDGSNFYRDLDLLILEAYLYDKEIIGHSSVISAMKFSEDNNIKCLALTHLNRYFRKNDLAEVRAKIESDRIKIIIPEPLEKYNL